ncbi:UNVERIFIED_CONTAM: hypothetical protein K2H54_030393 [Gekko kuhli]
MCGAERVLTIDPPENEPEKSAFKMQDGYAKNLIFGSVNFLDEPELRSIETSKKMVEFLKRKYGGRTNSKIHYLKAQNFDFKVKETDSLPEKLSKLRAIYNELKELGKTPDDIDMITAILKDPEAYAAEVRWVPGEIDPEKENPMPLKGWDEDEPEIDSGA